MSRQRYTEEFKIEAVKQATERGHPATEVAPPIPALLHHTVLVGNGAIALSEAEESIP